MEHEILYDGRAVLIDFTTKVDKRFLDDFPMLEVIGTNTTDISYIDTAECERRGIKIISLGTNETRDEKTRALLEQVSSTAEFTFMQLLVLARMDKRKVRGKILGLIGGHGRIGNMMHSYAQAFGMTTYIYDTKYDADNWKLNALLEVSDFVSLHIPLDRNKGFFTYEMFKKMKPTAGFINTSRKDIVEEGALIKALNEGLIRSAATDFLEDDTHPYLLQTSHIAGGTQEDKKLTHDFIFHKINEHYASIRD